MAGKLIRVDVLQQRVEQYRMEASSLRQKASEMTARATELERKAEGIATALQEPEIFVTEEAAPATQGVTRSLSVREMLDAYADQHGDQVQVAAAATAFFKAGYWQSKRGARNTLHSTLRHFAIKGVYQKIGRGLYKRLPSVALNGSLRRVGGLTLIEPHARAGALLHALQLLPPSQDSQQALRDDASDGSKVDRSRLDDGRVGRIA